MKTTLEKNINGIDRAALKKTVEDIKRQPDLSRCEFRLKNEWLGGDANRASVHDFYAAGAEREHKQTFRFEAGEPELLQGKDQGANPVEFLLSALSACITTTLAYYAAMNGIKIEKMESEFKGELDLRGLLNLDSKVRPGFQKIYAKFRVKTNGTMEQLQEYVRFSPVFDVVSKSVPVVITFETIYS